MELQKHGWPTAQNERKQSIELTRFWSLVNLPETGKLQVMSLQYAWYSAPMSS